MTTRNYCIINTQTGTCENVVLWDGTASWVPPQGTIALPQDTTPAKDWVLNQSKTDWVLEVSGLGQAGFVWDGTYLVTNQAKPEPLAPPPISVAPGGPSVIAE